MTCEHHVKCNSECCVVGPWCRSRLSSGSCLVSSRNGDQAWACSLTYPFASSRRLNVACCTLSWLSMVDLLPFSCSMREREKGRYMWWVMGKKEVFIEQKRVEWSHENKIFIAHRIKNNRFTLIISFVFVLSELCQRRCPTNFF